MRFLCFLFFILLTHVCPSKAQDALRRVKVLSYQVSVGYGRASSTRLLEGYVGGTRGYRETPVERYTGTFNSSFHAVYRQRIGWGISFAFENEEGSWHKPGQYTGNAIYSPQMGSFRRNVYAIALEVVVNYSRPGNRMIRSYGYFGVGYTYLNEVGTYSQEYYSTQYVNGVNPLGGNLEVSRNHDKTGFQVCPIGISVGRKYCGFAELGFGYKGIYNFGFRLKL